MLHQVLYWCCIGVVPRVAPGDAPNLVLVLHWCRIDRSCVHGEELVRNKDSFGTFTFCRSTRRRAAREPGDCFVSLRRSSYLRAVRVPVAV